MVDRQQGWISQGGLGISSRLFVGFLVIGVLVLGCFGWAASAKIAGAVIASGQVVVDSYAKKIQHRDGGVVAKLNVQNGDIVKAGDVIVRLDDTQAKAELGIIRAQLLEFRARTERLSAERDHALDLKFSEAFLSSHFRARDVARSELKLFRKNSESLESKKAQFKARINQLEQEAVGLERQQKSKESESVIIKKELKELKKLLSRKLVPISKVYALQRESKRIDGAIGGLIADRARIGGKISETEIEIISMVQKRSSEAQRELREIEARVNELEEKKVAVLDRLSRVDLKSPLSGTVHELNVHTVGGVISPAEVVAMIIPKNDALSVELKVSPVDIDQLSVGQAVRLRFTTFNQRTTPEVQGTVSRVSADVSTDSPNGQSYYRVRILPALALASLPDDFRLVPGMPVEGFVTTKEMPMISYLVKPFTDQFERVFREE